VKLTKINLCYKLAIINHFFLTEIYFLSPPSIYYLFLNNIVVYEILLIYVRVQDMQHIVLLNIAKNGYKS
jgi:hypothetical protein